MGKQRIDILLVERGLAESRTLAQRLVMAGQVRADGQLVPKPSTTVAEEAQLQVDSGMPFVSRGGEKLQAAMEAFAVDVQGKLCADVGASTGGFTDCLLQHGAAKVYAIDVGRGILHWKLREDPRVVVLEASNARHLDQLPETPALVTIDASFISLKTLLPVISGWFGQAGGQVLALVKPQFEAGRREASRGKGVIKDPEVHRRVLLDVLMHAQDQGYGLLGLLRSPLQGPKGNREFIAWLRWPGQPRSDVDEMVAAAVAEDATES